MNRFIPVLAALLLSACVRQSKNDQLSELPPGAITIVVHGGAGTITRGNMSAQKEKAYHEKLGEALDSGYSVLQRGGKSIEAVIAAIQVMEDSPLFNAGKGSVFTHDGRNELDAAIMDGSNLMAGAVAGVTTIKNPITAARAVMQNSDHVMLVGRGAEVFAEEQGLDIVPPSYFFDSIRYDQLLKALDSEKKTRAEAITKDLKFGTVGCVALDQFGNLAAGTSTGGMTNKKYGRVGDSPIIGAGTYANNLTCAISATGWGEYFIRLTVARDIAALMEYANLSVQEAADSVVMKKLPRLGGDGGAIALDRQGNFSMTFCTAGMYRGYKKNGERKTFIYRD